MSYEEDIGEDSLGSYLSGRFVSVGKRSVRDGDDLTSMDNDGSFGFNSRRKAKIDVV